MGNDNGVSTNFTPLFEIILVCYSVSLFLGGIGFRSVLKGRTM
jgi:hypothetical protein